MFYHYYLFQEFLIDHLSLVLFLIMVYYYYKITDSFLWMTYFQTHFPLKSQILFCWIYFCLEYLNSLYFKWYFLYLNFHLNYINHYNQLTCFLISFLIIYYFKLISSSLVLLSFTKYYYFATFYYIFYLKLGI